MIEQRSVPLGCIIKANKTETRPLGKESNAIVLGNLVLCTIDVVGQGRWENWSCRGLRGPGSDELGGAGAQLYGWRPGSKEETMPTSSLGEIDDAKGTTEGYELA